MENCSSTHFILGNDYLIWYGIDLHKNRDKYFTIGENEVQKASFLPFKRQIKVYKVSPFNLEIEKFKTEKIGEAEVSVHLTDMQENKLSTLLYKQKKAFETDKKTLGEIFCHEADIILKIERPHTRANLVSIVGDLLHVKHTSSRIKVKLMSSKIQANIEHTSHSCLTPNPVTSTNIGSPVPSTQIPHHLIIPQPSDGW
ncbi:hypothetical protein O181_024491 [Austropuccinia psidii MF-1]|uniref:Uncharacterized protein n=1 Tax=Austropuccinia psidii MF-1 TaxID=1389203 RepID=A0A9Q3CLJ5_9BASI|nr:hypothetical protein [Austropuccinia psidii MF-1]